MSSFRSGLKSGIVGLPNVGKSLFFNWLIGEEKAHSSNFPFCTIDPNIGFTEIKDKRLYSLAEKDKAKKITPSYLEIVDIAGLVEGASKGLGLGNKFLNHISNVDLIIHLLRGFDNDDNLNVSHIMNRIDPIEDYEIIESELRFSDIERLQRMMEKEKDKSKKKFYEDLIDKVLKGLSIDGEDFLSNKAKIIVYNGNKNEKVEAYFKKKSIPFYSFNILSLKENNEEEEAVELFKRDIFKSLGLISFFTSGSKESRSWSIIEGTKAPQAAAKIHSDFEKKFIRAEVTKYEDYMSNKPYLLKGKDYIVEDGDVINFRIG